MAQLFASHTTTSRPTPASTVQPPTQHHDDQISEQKSFTDGRIVVAGDKPRRRKQKRADYLLRYRRDFPIAIVEAKSIYKSHCRLTAHKRKERNVPIAPRTIEHIPPCQHW
jgi:hypothetical protein